MDHSHGCFIWYELLTSDVGAAQRFYCDVIGCTPETADDNPEEYHA